MIMGKKLRKVKKKGNELLLFNFERCNYKFLKFLNRIILIVVVGECENARIFSWVPFEFKGHCVSIVARVCVRGMFVLVNLLKLIIKETHHSRKIGP